MTANEAFEVGLLVGRVQGLLLAMAAIVAVGIIGAAYSLRSAHGRLTRNLPHEEKARNR